LVSPVDEPSSFTLYHFVDGLVILTSFILIHFFVNSGKKNVTKREISPPKANDTKLQGDDELHIDNSSNQEKVSSAKAIDTTLEDKPTVQYRECIGEVNTNDSTTTSIAHEPEDKETPIQSLQQKVEQPCSIDDNTVVTLTQQQQKPVTEGYLPSSGLNESEKDKPKLDSDDFVDISDDSDSNPLAQSFYHLPQ